MDGWTNGWVGAWADERTGKRTNRPIQEIAYLRILRGKYIRIVNKQTCCCVERRGPYSFDIGYLILPPVQPASNAAASVPRVSR